MKNRQNAKPESFIRQPNYPGGKKALDEFIKSELKYPEEALKNKIEGTVSIEHDVDIKGNVLEVRLKHGLGYGCDEEAMRLVKLLKYEGKRYRGMRVVFHKTLNIHFRLINTVTKPQEGPVLRYTIKENKPKEVKENKPAEIPKVVYTIRYDL